MKLTTTIKPLRTIFAASLLWMLFPLSVEAIDLKWNEAGSDQPLAEVLEELGVKYQVFFSYNAELLANVQVEFTYHEGESLDQAMSRLLANTPFDYETFGEKFFVVFEKSREGIRDSKKLRRSIEKISKLETKGNLNVLPQSGRTLDNIQRTAYYLTAKTLEKTVSGTVSNAAGEGLPGATVRAKGVNRGVLTDNLGKFELTLPDNVTTLIISYIGYETLEVEIAGRSVINIALNESVSLLDEVVVIGYGTQKKSDLTGAVSSVKSAEINAFPTTNVMQSLSGRAPGVQVLQSSGAPGGAVDVRIRGTNSIQGDNEPLYVVDGVPLAGQPTNINNADIQSVEILKDASATAIYGSRGANGVVIITTKAGFSGKTQVDFHTGYSVQSIIKRLDLMNASEYAQLHNIQAVNDGVAPYFTQAQIDAFGEGTDWQDLLFEQAPIWNTSLVVNGGDEKTQFSVGGSTFLQGGIIEGSDYNRYSFRTRFNHKIGDKIQVDVSMNTSRMRTGRKDSQGGARGTSLFNSVITSPPTASPYREDGAIFDFLALHPFVSPDQRNPLYDVKEDNRMIQANVVLGNISVSYNPTPSLTIKTLGGIENRDDRNDRYQTRNYRNSPGIAQVSTSQFTSLLSENTIAYNKSFAGKHNISAVGGFTYQNFLRTSLSASGSGFLSDVFETYNLGAAANSDIPASGFTESVLLSYLGRINYSLDNKYLLTVSFRTDGSSRFSEDNKWGYFPSGALAWRLSEEAFLKDNKLISNLKLRTSWGLTGSQAIEPYFTLNQLLPGNTIFGNDIFTTFAPGTRLPAGLKWETTEQIDMGVEIGILNNRLSLTADYYIKNTRDLLNVVGLPSSLGYTTTIQNVGTVQNRGLELGLDAYLFSGPGFNWNIYANAAFNRNEVKKLAGGKDILTNFVGILVLSDNLGILREGRPIGQFYGFLQDGYTENGSIKYKDLNGDGVINAEDKTYLGDPNPDVFFGFNSTMSFHGFQFTFFLQGAVGNEIFNVNAASSLDYGRGLNAPREVLTDHWTPSNPDAKYPVISRNSSAEVSDRFIEDGSFLRLKNVELAYSLPVAQLGAKALRQVQVYASGQNLLTATAYSWWDPEVNSRGVGTSGGVDHYSYPNAKSFTVGIRAGF